MSEKYSGERKWVIREGGGGKEDEEKGQGAVRSFLTQFLFIAAEIEEISLETYLSYLYYYCIIHLECPLKPKAITSAKQETISYGTR